MNTKNFYFIAILMATIFLSACIKDNDISLRMITSLGGGGNFTVINMGTNDTIHISGALQIGDGYQKLIAHNGNIIKIEFEPTAEYENYSFKTTYLLHDSTSVENLPSYEYVLKNVEAGEYRISLSAVYKSDSDLITAGGQFILKVEE